MGTGGAAGAAFFAYFLSLQKESKSGFGSEAPDSVYSGGAGGRPSRLCLLATETILKQPVLIAAGK